VYSVERPIKPSVHREESRKRWPNFRSCANVMASPAPTSATTPPATRAMSLISSGGVSQKSITSAKGPESYQPSQNRIRIRTARRFMPISLEPFRT
jgi:hypothetical protein